MIKFINKSHVFPTGTEEYFDTIYTDKNDKEYSIKHIVDFTDTDMKSNVNQIYGLFSKVDDKYVCHGTFGLRFVDKDLTTLIPYLDARCDEILYPEVDDEG